MIIKEKNIISNKYFNIFKAFSPNYENAKKILNLLKKNNKDIFFSLTIMDIFSKNQQERFLSTKILKNHKILSNFNGNNFDFAYNLEDFMENERNEDFFDNFITKSGEMYYKEENLINFSTRKIKEIPEENLENLVKILENDKVDISIKYSALEQLIEFFLLFNHLEKKNKINNVFLEKIFDFSLKNLKFFIEKIDYLIFNENHDENCKNQIIFLGKILNILNIFLVTENFKIDEILQEFNQNSFKIFLLKIIDTINKETKFQGLKTLFIIHFAIQNHQIYSLKNQNSISLIKLVNFEKNYIVLSNFSKILNEKNEFYSDFYPLNNDFTGFINEFFIKNKNNNEFYKIKQEIILLDFLNEIEDFGKENLIFEEIFKKWSFFFIYFDNFPKEFFSKDKLTNNFLKIIGSGFFGEKRNSIQIILDIFKNIFTKIDKIVYFYRIYNECKNFFDEIFEFISSQILGYFYEVYFFFFIFFRIIFEIFYLKLKKKQI